MIICFFRWDGVDNILIYHLFLFIDKRNLTVWKVNFLNFWENFLFFCYYCVNVCCYYSYPWYFSYISP